MRPAQVVDAISVGNDVNATGNCVFTESIVGGGAPGFGNLDADPQFLAAPADLRIRATSPARDATVLSAATIDRLRRPRDAAPDIGAFEAEQ